MKQIMAGKRLSAVFVPSKYCLPSNGRKIVKQINGSYTEDCRLTNIDYNNYQLMLVTAKEVLSKPFLSRLKKKTGSLSHS